MKHLKLITESLAVCLLASCTAAEPAFIDRLDPKIGTGGHGHVFVGADVPFGLVQLGPTSIPQQWDWCSGYHDSDSTVIGFSHTHLSGTGIGDLFDVTVMPVTGAVTYARGTEEQPESGLWSYADRSRETVKPGYYSVPLTRYGVLAEMTATARVGMHRYTFPASEETGIVFDLENGGCWDKATEVCIEQCASNAVRGFRHSTGWAKDQRIYFYAEFSRDFDKFEVIEKDGMKLYGRADFRTSKDEQILLKVALSPVSMDGAKKNMEAELAGWDFDATVKAAQELWNNELSVIEIETSDKDAEKIFYTALYHTMIAPALFCDVDGSYRGADREVHAAPGFNTYTTFSLWDTYRAAMPLYTITDPERYSDFVNTMLAIYNEQGKLPVWHLHGCETDCMVGNPGIPPVADAIVKGLEGFDKAAAFKAMKASAMVADRGQDFRMKYGYIPYDLFNESVAYDLEYALADASIANAAGVLAAEADEAGDTGTAAAYRADSIYFAERSCSWKHLFDPQLRFIRGKDSKGNFRSEYSPFASTHRADDYCEGNGWQYTWLVPHDFKGLCAAFGGRDELLGKLDSLFTAPSALEGDSSPDISGLIGQYAHGNEPSHHTLYFYTLAGQPWKTADKVRQVLSELYTAAPDGLSGNEDVGQMSAWYILSSLGFYEVEPGSGRYWFGFPNFDKATVKLTEGSLTITRNGGSDGYIQYITLNGKRLDRGNITYREIMDGGELVFHIGAEPKLWYSPVGEE